LWSYFDNPHWFLRHVGSIIHIGANSGEERWLYAKYKLRVLWIEALPNAFAKLKNNINSFPTQTAVNALVTDRDHEDYVFHVANNEGRSSSILEFGEHNSIWPDVCYDAHLMLKSITLDTLISDIGDGIAQYEAIVLDTQGSELLVLKGATRVIRQIRFIRTEAADFESYVGCAKLDELTNFLVSFGFKLIRKDIFAESPGGGQYFDVLYGK
jgi:FkbM family methyltransferase